MNRYLQNNNTVTVFVGPERKKFILNKELLCDRVPFFRGAFKTGFKESTTKKIDLPEDNADSFGLMVDWVYTDEVKCISCNDKICNIFQGDIKHDLVFFDLWILADKYQCVKLAEKALDRCSFSISLRNSRFSPEVLIYAFDKTTDASPLREMLYDHALVLFYSEMYGPLLQPKLLSELSAANIEFNYQLMKRIQNHAMAGKEHCNIEDCMLHDDDMRTEQKQLSPNEGYEGGMTPKRRMCIRPSWTDRFNVY